MNKKNLQKGAWAAGGAALLAAVSVLCVKGMKVVDKHIKAKQEADALAAEEAELFEETVGEAVEETAEDPVKAAEETPEINE